MKLYLPVLLLLVISISSLGQEKSVTRFSNDSSPVIKLGMEPRFYVNIHGGYALGLGSTFKFYPDDVTSIAVQQIENSPQVRNVKYKEESEGLGEGFRFGLGFSYIINDFINVGIDLDYFRSTINKIRDSSFYKTKTRNGNIDELSYNEKYKISYDANLLTFSPNITFKAISRPKFFIYNKVGGIVILRPKPIQHESRDGNYRMGGQGVFRDSSSFNQRRYEWGIKNPAFGFIGGIGAQVKLTQTIRTFAEFQISYVIFKVRNRTLTNFIIDGTEMINTLPISDREIIFRKSFTSEESDVDPSKPGIAIYQRFPITYVGLQLGIAYRF